MAKEIKFDQEGRTAILKGVNTLANAVKITQPNTIIIPSGGIFLKPINTFYILAVRITIAVTSGVIKFTMESQR